MTDVRVEILERDHPYGYRRVWVGEEPTGTVWRLGSSDEVGWPWYFQCYRKGCLICCAAPEGLVREEDAIEALLDHVRKPLVIRP